jgi:DeoR/GlpR family transcriptional regulator of sugar metabolism
VSELEAETSRLRRDLRERSEYGLYRQRGGGAIASASVTAAALGTRNGGGERARTKREASPADVAGAEPPKR